MEELNGLGLRLEQSTADKRTAAHALNLCLVSISQIIDYSDEYILEQEYEGILNNLNLEHMPKDEALLEILRQILDTITFFRIEEQEKRFIEREYQNRMKSAIWSAVPNCSVLVTSGDPRAILFSLVTQVGTGYMNYRNEKTQAGQDRDAALWQLQRAAIEQFNGLRRELFTTAWKLADRYEFPDAWRLTESQIDRYNQVLMDQNLQRRLVRLEDLENAFEAYPPFWYFKGHTAMLLSEGDPEQRQRMQEVAKRSYAHYFAANDINSELLRTDPICATCALEYVSLLDSTEEKLLYIERAIKSAGTHWDILQMCAMAYLDMGLIDRAAKLLRTLVCEGYNESVNAQLLSALYISEYLKGSDGHFDYLHRQLSALTGEDLIPWPTAGENTQEQYASFTRHRREALLNSYANFMCAYYREKAESFRKEVLDVQGNKEEAFVLFARQLEAEINDFPALQLSGEDYALLLREQESLIRELISPKYKVNSRLFEDIFADVIIRAVAGVADVCLETMEQITDFDLELGKAMANYYASRVDTHENGDDMAENTLDALFKVDRGLSQRFNAIKAMVKKSIVKEDTRWARLLLSGESEYYQYIQSHDLDSNYIIAVINDRSFNDCDLLITENGLLVQRMQSKAMRAAGSAILSAMHGVKADGVAEATAEKTASVLKQEVPYADVSYKTGKLLNPSYSNKYVDMEQLFALVEACKREFTDTVEDRIRGAIRRAAADDRK